MTTEFCHVPNVFVGHNRRMVKRKQPEGNNMVWQKTYVNRV